MLNAQIISDLLVPSFRKKEFNVCWCLLFSSIAKLLPTTPEDDSSMVSLNKGNVKICCLLSFADVGGCFSYVFLLSYAIQSA